MTTCLSMIVKNESHCIERCLKSVRPFIDCYAISDTGSTDGTQELISKSLLGLPGKITSDKWIDFRTNRNLALNRTSGDWTLLIDADEEMIGESKLELSENVDAYMISYSYGGHWLVRLIKNVGNWIYSGPPTHEVLTPKIPCTVEKLTTHTYIHHADSIRRKSGEKFTDDIQLLLKAVKENPIDSRTVFYLAESYRFSGDNVNALKWYKQRTNLVGFVEETYWSLYQIARLSDHQDEAKVIENYLLAWSYRPSRQEALYDLCLYLRGKQRWALIYALTKNIEITKQSDLLCVDVSAEWKVLEECGVALYNLGRKQEAKAYFSRILFNYALKVEELQRTQRNLAFTEKL